MSLAGVVNVQQLLLLDQHHLLQGDFVVALLDTLGPELSKPARDVSEVTLNHLLRQALLASAGGTRSDEEGGAMERLRAHKAVAGAATGCIVLLTAVNWHCWPSTSAWQPYPVQYHASRTRWTWRVHVGLVDLLLLYFVQPDTAAVPNGLPCLFTGDAETGWDVFSLHYQLGPPLSSIFTPAAQTSYSQLSRLLWLLRRTERSLGAAWHTLKVRPAGKCGPRDSACMHRELAQG